MIDIQSMSQVILKDAGYDVRLASLQSGTIACFEDAAIIGFVATFTSAPELIKKWKAYETEILSRFAPNFRAAGDKAWNVYCCFLTDGVPNPTETREIGWIEENLELTRKLAAAGIGTREELTRALLPLLPIQYQPVLLETEITERLGKRIAEIAPAVALVALDDKVPAQDVVGLLEGKR